MTNTKTLQVTTPSDCEIAMTRVFDAPRRLVFEAFTRPELLKRWLLGPPGWSMVVCEIALQPGDTYRFVWRKDDGTVMGMRGVCREIVPPERMVQTESFDQPWYPGEALVTTVLAEEGGKTGLTTTVRYESREVRDSILTSNMTRGVEASYNRLAELVARGLEKGAAES